jgi:hypothetical protein
MSDVAGPTMMYGIIAAVVVALLVSAVLGGLVSLAFFAIRHTRHRHHHA